MSDPIKKARKQLTLIRRYERRLRQRLDDIEWEESQLLPELEELERKAAQGELPEFTVETE